MRLQSQIDKLGQISLRRARPLLGTLVEIDVSCNQSESAAQAAIDAAFEAVALIQTLMSYHDARSEISHLNAQGHRHAVTLSAHSYKVIEAALSFASLSEGAFDPCVARQLEAWGLLPVSGMQMDPAASWRDIELLGEGRVRFRRPLGIDLGGIAKGYAVDLAVGVLVAHGIFECVVNAGGDLRVNGEQSQSVQLRHPLDPSRIAQVLPLQSAALATSAAYFSRRHLAGREVSHLVDTQGGAPFIGTRSVSVCAPNCMSADALTKIVLFADAACAGRVLDAFQARAYVLDPATLPEP